MKTNYIVLAGPYFMPDGNGRVQPVPYVMLDDELIRFCRLDKFGLRNPENTLRYYRRKGILKSSKLSGRNVTTIWQAIEFLKNLEK